MKTNLIILAAAIAFSHSASAQTSSTTTTIPESPANSSVATSTAANAPSTNVKPLVKYVGYFFGPGMEFSGTQKDTSVYEIEHRLSLGAKINPNLDIGLQTRTKTDFGSGTDLSITAGNFRAFATVKNLYQDDLFNLTLIPRLYLPTSKKARNTKVTVSPDLIADLSISPKNSRFSIDAGLEYIHFLHTDGAIGGDYTNAITGSFDPWLEVDYQATAKTQLMISYWPILNSYARKGSGLSSAASGDGSNEIDIGAYYEISSGLKLNPYIAAEMNDMDYSSPQKNMQVNLILTAAIL